MQLLRKISLLFVSILVISSGVLLPSLPNIIRDYPMIPPTIIELLGTLPALFTMLVIPFSPNVAKIIGYKKTVQIGLVIAFISGILPIYVHSFLILFLTRITFGVGIGLFNPLLYSFSTSLYQGVALTKMLGYQSAFEGMGGIVTSFLVAQLVAGGWRHTLWTYLIILPILLLFSLFIPDVHPSNQKTTNKEKVKIDKNFFVFIGLLVVLITIYMSVSIKISAFLNEQHFGTVKDASNGLALMGVGAMMAGLLFGINTRIFKQWLLVVSFLGMSVSLYVLANTQSVFWMIMMNFTIGLSFRTFIPYLLNLANQVDDGMGERRTALLLVGFNIGSAFAPVTINLFSKLLHLSTVKSIYLMEAFIVLIIAIATGVHVCYKQYKI